MTDIHWIKLSTDLLVNRKILYLRHMPERVNRESIGTVLFDSFNKLTHQQQS